jgi:hypothetical protein
VGTRAIGLLFAALLLAVPLLLGCQTLQIGSSSCVGLDERDCYSAEATAKLAAPAGRGPIARIDVERNWEGCFLVLCDRLRATVRIAYLNSDEIVTVHVERESPLTGMQATHVEVGRSTR